MDNKYLTKYRKEARRFRNKYVTFLHKYLFLKRGIQRALNEMERASDVEATNQYQLGVNYGLMCAFEMLEIYTDEKVKNNGFKIDDIGV